MIIQISFNSNDWVFRTGQPFWLKAKTSSCSRGRRAILAFGFRLLKVNLLSSVTLLDAEQTMAEWGIQEGMAARHRPWVSLAADFEGSSHPFGEGGPLHRRVTMVEVQEPQHTRRDQPTRLSPGRGRNRPLRREFKSWNVLSKCWERIPGPSSRVLQNSLKKAKASAQGVPVGVQLEQSLKFVERSEKRCASPRRRAREGGQVVGRSATTCRTFAFRVGSREAHTTLHQRFPPDYAQEIGSVESLCGGIATRAGRSSCTCSRGRSRSLPNPSPDLFAGELQRGSVVNRGSQRLSSVMETLIDNAESSARSNHRFYSM